MNCEDTENREKTAMTSNVLSETLLWEVKPQRGYPGGGPATLKNWRALDRKSAGEVLK